MAAAMVHPTAWVRGRDSALGEVGQPVGSGHQRRQVRRRVRVGSCRCALQIDIGPLTGCAIAVFDGRVSSDVLQPNV